MAYKSYGSSRGFRPIQIGQGALNEQRRKDDERSKRKRKRKRFFNNIGYALGDAVDFVGDVGKFVIGV